jgi:hypothetical protein
MLGVLKSEDIGVSTVLGSVTGSFIGTASVVIGLCLGFFIGGCIYPVDTKVKMIQENSTDELRTMVTKQKLIKNPTLKERLREGGKQSGIGVAGALLGGLLVGVAMCGIAAAIEFFGMEGIADLLI